MNKFRLGELIRCKFEDSIIDGKMGVIVEVVHSDIGLIFYEVEFKQYGKFILAEAWMERL